MVTHPCPPDGPLLAGVRGILAADAPVCNNLLCKINVPGPIVRLGGDRTRNAAALYAAGVG